MAEQIRIYLNDGRLVDLSDYQSKKELGADQIGRFFSKSEAVFQENCNEYDHVYSAEPLLTMLDALREEQDSPVILTSLFRGHAKQQSLIERGLTEATVSPHNLSMAADIDRVGESDVTSTVKTLKTLSKSLSIPIRLGYKNYLNRGDTFIHLDVCPFYYGNKGPFEDHAYLLREYEDKEVPYAFRQNLVQW